MVYIKRRDSVRANPGGGHQQIFRNSKHGRDSENVTGVVTPVGRVGVPLFAIIYLQISAISGTIAFSKQKVVSPVLHSDWLKTTGGYVHDVTTTTRGRPKLAVYGVYKETRFGPGRRWPPTDFPKFGL